MQILSGKTVFILPIVSISHLIWEVAYAELNLVNNVVFPEPSLEPMDEYFVEFF
jgi:hypothetical protein